MADKKYTITDYSIIDQLEAQDYTLMARPATNEYFSVPWSMIQDKIDLKADIVANEFGNMFGMAMVNDQGIVTDLKRLEATDIPNLEMSQVNGLLDALDTKANKAFANDTDGYVLGSFSFEFSEEGSLILVATYVSPDGKLTKEETKQFDSAEGGISFSKNVETGNIDITVDPTKFQKQADWTQNDDTKIDYIKNKPLLHKVATSGDYYDLLNQLVIASGDTLTLSIDWNEELNKYTFTVPHLATWGQIEGQLDDQDDLKRKFSQYYSISQIDAMLAEINAGLFKVKGYISLEQPEAIPPKELEDGTCWVESDMEGEPEGSTFNCKRYVKETNTWVDSAYTASDFDIWINNNGNENTYFWLGNRWEQLDFHVDLTLYYTKDEINGFLNTKQDKLEGTAGTVVTYTDTKGVLTETKLHPVATSGSYNDLIDKPIQEQADWAETDDTKVTFIQNKPSNYDFQADWEEADFESKSFIRNKPSIPDPQIQSDWGQDDENEVDFIKNKPSLDFSLEKHEVRINGALFDGVRTEFAIVQGIVSTKQVIDLYWNGVKLVAPDDYTLGYGSKTAVVFSAGSYYSNILVDISNLDKSTITDASISTKGWTIYFDSETSSIYIELGDGTEQYLMKNGSIIMSEYSLTGGFTIDSIEGVPARIFYTISGEVVSLTLAPDPGDSMVYTYTLLINPNEDRPTTGNDTVIEPEKPSNPEPEPEFPDEPGLVILPVKTGMVRSADFTFFTSMGDTSKLIPTKVFKYE